MECIKGINNLFFPLIDLGIPWRIWLRHYWRVWSR